MRYFPFLIMMILYTSLLPVTHAQAHDGIYYLTNDHTSYYVTLLNPQTQESRLIFTLLRSSAMAPDQIFPQEELVALRVFLQAEQMPPNPNDLLTTCSNISQIAVSPDNTQLAMVITYGVPLSRRTGGREYFGTSQVVVIGSTQIRPRILMNLAMHSEEWFSDGSFPETRIEKIEWSPDQSFLAIRVNSGRNLGNRAIVAVPVQGEAPFKIGEGMDFAIAPDSRQITLMVTLSPVRLPEAFKVYDMDSSGTRVTLRSTTWTPYAILDGVGLAYLGSEVVFASLFEWRLSESTMSGLAMFNPVTGEARLIAPGQSTQRLQGTPDGSHLVIENTDQELFRVTGVVESTQLQPISTAPVYAWSLNGQGELVVQYADSEDYHLLDSLGNPQAIIPTGHLAGVESVTDQFTLLSLDW